jgi:hypothetical protein
MKSVVIDHRISAVTGSRLFSLILVEWKFLKECHAKAERNLCPKTSLLGWC